MSEVYKFFTSTDQKMNRLRLVYGYPYYNFIIWLVLHSVHVCPQERHQKYLYLYMYISQCYHITSYNMQHVFSNVIQQLGL